MTFGFDTSVYKIIRERLQIVKIENITNIMINVFVFMRKNVEKSKEIMTTQVNKHRKSIKYFKEDMI